MAIISFMALLTLAAFVPSESRWTNFEGVLHPSGTVIKTEHGHEDHTECEDLCDDEADCDCVFFQPDKQTCQLAKGCEDHTEDYANPDGTYTVSIRVPDVDVDEIYKTYAHTNTRNGFGSIALNKNRMAKKFLTEQECVDRCTVDNACDCVVYMQHAQYDFKPGTCWMRQGLQEALGCDPDKFEVKGTTGFEVFVKPRPTHLTASTPATTTSMTPTTPEEDELMLGPELVPLNMTDDDCRFKAWFVDLEQKVSAGDLVFQANCEGKIRNVNSPAEGWVDELDDQLAPGFTIKANTMVAVIRIKPSSAHWYWIAALVVSALILGLVAWFMQRRESKVRAALLVEEEKSLMAVSRADSEAELRLVAEREKAEAQREKAEAQREKAEALALLKERLAVHMDFKQPDGTALRLVLQTKPLGMTFEKVLPIKVQTLKPGKDAERQGVKVGAVLTQFRIGTNTPTVLPPSGTSSEFNKFYGELTEAVSLLPQEEPV